MFLVSEKVRDRNIKKENHRDRDEPNTAIHERKSRIPGPSLNLSTHVQVSDAIVTTLWDGISRVYILRLENSYQIIGSPYQSALPLYPFEAPPESSNACSDKAW